MKEAGGFLLLVGLILMAFSAVLGLSGAYNALESSSVFVSGFVLGLIGAALIDKSENARR
jgi:hypothetical protein